MSAYPVYYKLSYDFSPPEGSDERAAWLADELVEMSWSVYEGDHNDAARAILDHGPARASLDKSTPYSWPGYLWIRSEAHGLTRHELVAEERVKRWTEPVASRGVAFGSAS